jgi:hypothetical protein
MNSLKKLNENKTSEKLEPYLSDQSKSTKKRIAIQSKPVVHFAGTPIFYTGDSGFEMAKVYGLDHPILGTDIIRTSLVLQKFEDGSFETLNSLYVSTKDD